MSPNLCLSISRFLAACTLLLASSLAQAQVSPAVSKGLQWMASQVQANGHLLGEPNSIASQFQNRSEAVQTLQLLSPPALPQLVDAMSSLPEANSEYLARQILAFSVTGRPLTTSADQLFARQNIDGGFGAASGFDSNVLDTAWTLKAIQALDRTMADARIVPVIAYLRLAQRPDGAFALVGNSAQELTTAQVLGALQLVPRSAAVLDAINKAAAFLLSRQTVDGGWGNVAQTSSVYLALLGSMSDAGVQDRVTAYLSSRQGADGSWGADPFVTALTLRALVAQPRPVPTTGDITVQIADASTGLPISTAAGVIQGASSASAQSNVQGKLVLSAILAGTYTMSISAPGYVTQSKNLTLQAGTTVDLGTVLMLPVATTGGLQGVVKNAATGAGIEGALVSIAGSATAAATTLADGSYSLANLAPGAVTVSASKAGYASLGGAGTITAGATLTFSPSLQLAQAQSTTGSLVGVVRDSATGTPLAGVLIAVSGSATGSVLSASDGTFTLTGLSPGSVTVTASKAGYGSAAGAGGIAAGAVLNFSPSLVLAGQTTPTTGGVSGQVKDSATQAGLGGAVVSITGSTTASATTAADGSYSLSGLAPGAITVTASKAGYTSSSASGSVAAGTLVLFSPSLQGTLGSISGQVVDAVGGAPLAGVTVTAGAGNVTALTDANGRFSLMGLAVGGYSLNFNRLGYTPRSLAAVLVTAGAATQLPAMALTKAATSVTLSGAVTDVSTGQPLAGASVAVLGVNLSATTNGAGTYRIDGLPIGLYTLRFSAVGYASETVVRNVDQLAEFKVDAALSAGQASSLSLSRLATDKANYGAYAPARFQIDVENTGGQTVSATVGLSVVDANGKTIDSLDATWIDASGTAQRRFSFPQGITSIAVPWDTKAHPPGVYTVVTKVYQSTADLSAGSIELAARRAGFAIDPTQALTSAILTPVPAFTNIGATERVGFKLDIVNRSNVPVMSKFNFQIVSPTQVAVYGSSVEVALEPQEDTKSILLSGFEYQFFQSGLFNSTLAVGSGPVPTVLDAKAISVAPGTRIDPAYSVAPGVVTPDGDKRVRIDIKLQGVEQK